MGVKLFTVLDKATGQRIISQAVSAKRAEQFQASGRFVATKSTPAEITAFVAGGGQIVVADTDPVVEPMALDTVAPVADHLTEAGADAPPAVQAE